MANASSRVVLNRMKIKQLSRATIVALEKTADAMITDAQQAQVIPFDTGHLQGSEGTWLDDSRSSNGVVSIVHSTPYARRLYFHPEYNFQTTENPNAKGRWWDEWLTGKKSNFAQKTFAQLYKKEAGT